MTESGPLKLVANSQHYVKRTDVEHLLQQGGVQHI